MLFGELLFAYTLSVVADCLSIANWRRESRRESNR